jgi:hypothetical protein
VLRAHICFLLPKIYSCGNWWEQVKQVVSSMMGLGKGPQSHRYEELWFSGLRSTGVVSAR